MRATAAATPRWRSTAASRATCWPARPDAANGASAAADRADAPGPAAPSLLKCRLCVLAMFCGSAMSALKNDTFLRALQRQPTDYTPIWLMRQAGRYLPEYRATRARAGSFLTLCKTPDLATEVTLQPLARYPLDAAILFSDILTVPDAMGLGLYFAAGRRPALRAPGARRMAEIARPRRARPRRQAALRDGRGALDPPRARRLGAADRLFRQPLDAGLLHGRGRQARTTTATSRPCCTAAPTCCTASWRSTPTR